MFKKFTTSAFLSAILFLGMNCVVSAPDNTTSATNGTNTNTNTTTSCVTTPAYNASLTDSTSTSVSHRFGEDCMSCHSLGNGASQHWTVAGSMADGNNSTTKAAAGSTISAIATENLTLTVDSCGNFYTTQTATNIAASMPMASAQMGLSGWGTVTATAGSCNQSVCHDNTAGNQSYIY